MELKSSKVPYRHYATLPPGREFVLSVPQVTEPGNIKHYPGESVERGKVVWMPSVDAKGLQLYAPTGDASIRGVQTRPYEQLGIDSHLWQMRPTNENYASEDQLARLAASRGLIPGVDRAVPLARCVPPPPSTQTGFPGFDEWKRRWHHTGAKNTLPRPYQFWGLRHA
jgi:hypothetical protein